MVSTGQAWCAGKTGLTRAGPFLLNARENPYADSERDEALEKGGLLAYGVFAGDFVGYGAVGVSLAFVRAAAFDALQLAGAGGVAPLAGVGLSGAVLRRSPALETDVDLVSVVHGADVDAVAAELVAGRVGSEDTEAVLRFQSLGLHRLGPVAGGLAYSHEVVGLVAFVCAPAAAAIANAARNARAVLILMSPPSLFREAKDITGLSFGGVRVRQWGADRVGQPRST